MIQWAICFLCQSSNNVVHQRIKVCTPSLVGLEGHDLESDVMLLSFFLGDNTLISFSELVFLSLVGFFHGLNFSVYFSVSSTVYGYLFWF